MTSPFYSPPSFSTLPPPPLPIQVVNAISIFGNYKIVFLQFKGCMLTANWPLKSFSYFYHVLVLLPVNIVNLVHMCLRTNIRGGRQFNMFMSENICTMVDLFDKAVVGGGKIITVERKSEGDNQTLKIR